MTLDPRTQLAQTMLRGFTSQNASKTRKKTEISNERDRPRKSRDRQSMEALTQALLDPFTTVQEAELNSLIRDTEIASPVMKGNPRTSGK